MWATVLYLCLFAAMQSTVLGDCSAECAKTDGGCSSFGGHGLSSFCFCLVLVLAFATAADELLAVILLSLGALSQTKQKHTKQHCHGDDVMTQLISLYYSMTSHCGLFSISLSCSDDNMSLWKVIGT